LKHNKSKKVSAQVLAVCDFEIFLKAVQNRAWWKVLILVNLLRKKIELKVTSNCEFSCRVNLIFLKLEPRPQILLACRARGLLTVDKGK